MHESLRPMLMGIVLLNLIFVQITQAVSWSWLIPLYSLTLVGPLLTRFHDSLLYRFLWNLAVLATFAVLAHHATNRGITYLLEDGLILSALCQVHLFNNLGERQKPDLLFFNSFLIAFVTSFFCQDIEYLAVFVAYVLWALPTLQVYVALDRPGKHETSIRDVVRDALPKSIAVLGLTVLAFFLWPRDFYRDGWVNEAMYTSRSSELAVGFSEEVRLGRYGNASLSHQEVFRVTVRRGEGFDVPAHWRGATFLHYGPNGWFAEKQLQHRDHPNYDVGWSRKGFGTWTRGARPTGSVLAVRLADPSGNRLFLPLNTNRFRITSLTDPDYLGPLIDGTVVYLNARYLAPQNRPLAYDVSLSTTSLGAPELTEAQLRQLVSLDDKIVPRIAFSLADSLRSQLPPGHTDRDLVEAFRRHLSSGYDYLLPGDPGAASGLGDFLAGTGGGHCEYFATALAVLLRTQDIPCRLVTGFLVTEWDEESSSIVARESDAHAWVEVLDPVLGWYVVDPNPPSTDSDPAGAALLSTVIEYLESTWAAVTGFGSDQQRAAWLWLKQLPRRLPEWVLAHPWAVAAMALALALAIIWRRRRMQERIPPAVTDYRLCLARARLELLPGETPRELLARATGSSVPGNDVQELAAATGRHESQRYAH